MKRVKSKLFPALLMALALVLTPVLSAAVYASLYPSGAQYPTGPLDFYFENYPSGNTYLEDLMAKLTPYGSYAGADIDWYVNNMDAKSFISPLLRRCSDWRIW